MSGVIWVLGCRSGSNLLVEFLRFSGAHVPIREPKEPNTWNPQWGEDNYLLSLTSTLLGNEPNISVQRQMRPPTDDRGWRVMPELLSHFREAIKLVPNTPTVFKWGGLPYCWPEIERELRSVEHSLVYCRRNREARERSLARLNPQATLDEIREFLDRHDRAAGDLITKFTGNSRRFVECNFDEVRTSGGQTMGAIARAFGLSPTLEAFKLFDPNKIGTPNG